MKKDRSDRRDFLAIAGSLGLAACGLPVAGIAAAHSHYAAKVLAKRPIAYWRLGEPHGPAALDATGNGHDGGFHGNLAYRERGALKHDGDTAVQFDGRNSYVEIPDSGHFSQPASGRGLTVEAWVRPDALKFTGETQEHYVHWLGKGDAGRYEWGFRFYSRLSSRPNRISAYIWNPDGGEGAGAYFQDAVQAGQWIHVVACYDPGDRTDPNAGVSIYKNGVLRANPASSPGARYRAYDIVPHHGNAPLRLGTRDLKSFLTGGLDEVAIYPRVLSPEEIRDNYESAQ